MTQRKTKVYDVDGTLYGFDATTFRDMLREKAAHNKTTIREAQNAIANAVCVSPSTVHAWYVGQNAPNDIHVVIDLARVFETSAIMLLEKRGESMANQLSDKQREALSRIWQQMYKTLVFLDTKQLTQTEYGLMFGITAPDTCYGQDLRDVMNLLSQAGVTWYDDCHALNNEYVWLGKHPVFSELSDFVYGPLHDFFESPFEHGWTVTDDGDETDGQNDNTDNSKNETVIYHVTDGGQSVPRELLRRDIERTEPRGHTSRPSELLKMLRDILNQYI